VEAIEALTHFQLINRTRIERLKELAPKSQQDFFDLLAFLFHLNSEGLPGYISDDTPTGIVDYQPSNTTIDAAKSIAPHFNFKRRPFRHYPIQGVYLINDHGIVNTPETAEYELWLVHDVGESPHKLLQQKLAEIKSWAKSLKITLHTRLLSKESLSQNTLSADDLNRLYLNGLVLAGSSPLWWAISPEQEESDYLQAAQTITQQRVLGHTSIIDFGPLSAPDTQLLLDQSASLLLTSLDHGLDCVFNLAYYQHLLDDFSETSWLCQHAKQGVFHGQKDPLALDSNVLKLHAVMSSKSISYEDKLLAQQSLYIHFNERLSQHVSLAAHPWRRHFIKQLVSYWKWPQHLSETLDKRQNSNYRQCLSEYEQVSKLYINIQESLNLFAKKQSLNIEQENRQFKQKYRLFHDFAPNTIAYLPSSLLPNNADEDIYLHRFDNDSGWMISDISLDSDKQQPLFKALSLLHVLTWAVRNHLLTKANRIKVADHTEQVAVSLVLKLVQQLLRSPLSGPPPVITKSSLDKPAKLKQVMLFINLENEGHQDTLSQQGLIVSSLQNDPLNYALKKRNLVFTIEGLIYSSWGQWHYFFHSGTTATLEMINTILLWQPSQSSPKLTRCWCPSEAHGKSIELRLTKLYNDVITHYQKSTGNGNYLISIAEKNYSIQWQPGSCDYTFVSKANNILQILSSPKPHFSKTKVDDYLDPKGLYAQLLRLQSPDQITLFLSSQKNGSIIFLLDEKGTLFNQEFSELTESTLNNHFYQFLSSVKQKNNISHLRFYRLAKTTTKSWKVNAMPLTNTSQQQYLPVTIEMSSAENNAQCTINCGPHKFRGKADDHDLFQQVNKLILSLRKSNEPYPLYITELSFPQGETYSTDHYIIQKQRLESLLNYR